MRWVTQVPVTTCAEAASAASTSPRSMRVVESTLACFGFTWGAPGRMDSAGSRTGGSGWYSTSTSAAASRAMRGLSAATAASTSPTARTSSPSATSTGQSL